MKRTTNKIKQDNGVAFRRIVQLLVSRGWNIWEARMKARELLDKGITPPFKQ